MVEVVILSPHGALRAYTVFLTAEPRRGSFLVLSYSVTVLGVALRAYPELLTAENLRLSLIALSFHHLCCIFLNERAVIMSLYAVEESFL